MGILLSTLTALLLGYFIGSVPSAALLARLKRSDIFAVGSSNMGAMNTARHLGWRLGALVLGLDLAKGALASAVGLGLTGADTTPLPAAASSVGAVVGHLWSVWVGFRGGKGLATTLGVALPLYPLGGLYGFGAFLLPVLLLRKKPNAVDSAVFITAPLYPVLVFLSLPGAPTPVALTLASSAAFIALAVALKHLLVARRAHSTHKEGKGLG